MGGKKIMARTTPWMLRGLLALIVAVICTMPVQKSAVAAEPTINVIVNPSVGVTVLTRADLEAIYKRQEREWRGDGGVIPFNHEWSSPLRRTFDHAVLGLDPAGSQKYWVDTLIRGGPQPPRTITSSLLVSKLVSRLPGAIGYVEDGVDTQGTRVVAQIRGGLVVAP